MACWQPLIHDVYEIWRTLELSALLFLLKWCHSRRADLRHTTAVEDPKFFVLYAYTSLLVKWSQNLFQRMFLYIAKSQPKRIRRHAGGGVCKGCGMRYKNNSSYQNHFTKLSTLHLFLYRMLSSFFASVPPLWIIHASIFCSLILLLFLLPHFQNYSLFFIYTFI